MEIKKTTSCNLSNEEKRMLVYTKSVLGDILNALDEAVSVVDRRNGERELQRQLKVGYADV